ncbi:hypothetical protein BJX99DRAFT_231498 [Aspergillus californicus]
MCSSQFMLYTCGCKRESEFIQCLERRGSNVKCKPITKLPATRSMNYCEGHLVPPDAPKKYYSKVILRD